MCGIVAIYQYNSSSTVDRDELVKIRDRMTSRGPDGFGEWYSSDNRVGLGHRRLAIIDLSESGAQPMSNGTTPVPANVLVTPIGFRRMRPLPSAREALTLLQRPRLSGRWQTIARLMDFSHARASSSIMSHH